jgi:hypothetical protein
MLQGFDSKTGIQCISLEIPLAWMENPVDGQTNQLFCASLIAQLSRYGIPLYLYTVPVGADFCTRQPRRGEIIFSYHSVGFTPNVFRIKEAPIRPFYSIDPAGYAGWSEIARRSLYHAGVDKLSIADARRTIASCRNEFCISRKSKYPQKTESSGKLPERFVFLPLQVLNDSVSNLSFFSGLELLAAAAAQAEQLRLHLVVKRHPFCRSFAVESLLRVLSEKNEFFAVSDDNVHDLIERCHSVVTVNSGVGMEALIHGKPVYCTGQSEWAAAAIRLESLDGVRQAFSDQFHRTSAYQEKLLAFLLSEYWVDPKDQKRIDRRLKECLASFDPDYGEGAFEADERHALNSELLRLHAELDHQTKIAKLAMIDFEQAKKEALSLRRDARLVRAAKKGLRRALSFFKPG